MSIAYSALKTEISRVARKGSRAETQTLRKASTQYRSDIAALKRQLQMLEKKIRLLAKSSGGDVSEPAAPTKSTGGAHRFSAKRLAAHRKRLGLSAQALGTLLNVSGQSVYHWERGMSRPRAAQMPAIAALRTLSKKSAAAVLESLGR